MNKKTFIVTAIIGLLLVGGAGFGFYAFKMNRKSFKGISIPVNGLNEELPKKWEAIFEKVLSEDEFLQGVVDETDYANKMDVPASEAVAHLKEAAKARYVKRKKAIEVGLVGKRKQDETLAEIGRIIYEMASKEVAMREPTFRQYLDVAKKAKANAKSQQPPSE